MIIKQLEKLKKEKRKNLISYFFTLNTDYHVTIPMNKLGIWAIAIAGAFLIGILSANPVVEAVGGWQAAFTNHEADGSAHGIDSLSVVLGTSFDGNIIQAISNDGQFHPAECPAGNVMTGISIKLIDGQIQFRPICSLISLG